MLEIQRDECGVLLEHRLVERGLPQVVLRVDLRVSLNERAEELGDARRVREACKVMKDVVPVIVFHAKIDSLHLAHFSDYIFVCSEHSTVHRSEPLAVLDLWICAFLQQQLDQRDVAICAGRV